MCCGSARALAARADERCTCVFFAGSLVSMKQGGELHNETRIRFDETILSI
jgi:hypothetical protein